MGERNFLRHSHPPCAERYAIIDNGMGEERIRVAAAQAVAVPAEIERNVATAARLIDEAAAEGATVVVFPELFLCCYDLEAIALAPERCDLDEDDPRLDPLREACRAGALTAVVGASLRRDGGRTISALVVGEGGETVARADKQHVDRSELPLFQPGEEGCAFDARGWRLAVGICRDGSFPEHARAAALAGADAYLCPVSHDRVSVVHPARAFENTMYVALSNHVGPNANGHSAVYGPEGEVLADAGEAESALAVADFERARLAELRERRPVLAEARQQR